MSAKEKTTYKRFVDLVTAADCEKALLVYEDFIAREILSTGIEVESFFAKTLAGSPHNEWVEGRGGLARKKKRKTLGVPN